MMNGTYLRMSDIPIARRPTACDGRHRCVPVATEPGRPKRPAICVSALWERADLGECYATRISAR